MADVSQPVDFDARPPMPVAEYEQTVKCVSVGYELAFTLVRCFLRALHQPDLNLLVVGVGGGAEIERFLPDNSGWRITGVDPSQDMLALARAKVERAGIGERVSLIQGSVGTLPADGRFDAATCLFVLHFLPDSGKLALLREIFGRLHTGAPLIVVSGTHPDDVVLRDDGLRDDFLGAWQQYGELMGMPAERMAATIQQLATQVTRPDATSEEAYVQLLHEAGFTRVGRFFSVLGGTSGWIAR